MDIMSIVIPVAVVLIALVVIGLMFARLYQRASKEISFVRTGFGGELVVLNGGALVFPVLHETIPVNMNTLRLEVERSNHQALITKDRMRVDVLAEFYVRVKPAKESIAHAAQTLGQRTMNPAELKALVEGKFVDALRSVAAEMDMKELHEQRSDFVAKVQEGVHEDLIKNGLELESVSLTGLDQTSKEYFNPDNAFDAEGLTKLTEEIESRRKIRNDIEQDTKVQMATKDLQAEKETLEINRDKEYAHLEQSREIEIRRASQASEIVTEQASKERAAEEARIAAKRAVDLAGIEASREVEEQRIDKERTIEEKQISKDRAIETADVERSKTVQLAEQDKAIAISEKSEQESDAKAKADIAKQSSVKEAEGVITVRETAIAERDKGIVLVKAKEEAEKSSIGIVVAAEAQKVAAEDTAVAIETLATAEAQKVTIQAGADAEATKLRADADERRFEVEAEGANKLNEAANILSNDQIEMQTKIELMGKLPAIIRESVKPMENIDGIKIIQVDGLNGRASDGVSSDGTAISAGSGNLADNVTNAALQYRTHAPIIDGLMSELGLSGGDINGMVETFSSQHTKPTAVASN